MNPTQRSVRGTSKVAAPTDSSKKKLHASAADHPVAAVERPGLEKLRQDIVAGLVATILAYMDRLWPVIRSDRAWGRKFWSICQPAMAEPKVYRVASVVGQWARASHGYWNGAPAPVGYRNKNGTLIPLPSASKVIARMFELFIQLGSSSAVRAKLAKQGIRHVWSSTRAMNAAANRRPVLITEKLIENIISNPVYAGFVPGPRGMALLDPNCVADLTVGSRGYFRGRHRPIVSRAVWTKAARLRLDGLTTWTVKAVHGPGRLPQQ